MPIVPLIALIGLIAVLVGLVALLLAAIGTRRIERLRLLAEQALAGQRAEAETTRRHLADTERVLSAGLAETRLTLARGLGEIATRLADEQGRLRLALAEGQEKAQTVMEARLAEIRKSVDEQLQAAVEKQMNESFNRVIDQFAAVQKAMGDVQAVTAQIGDIRRLFSNVRARGGWGEAQLRALLDDLLPAGSYETNRKLDEASDEVVEFALILPARGGERVLLAIDAKFPTEDYERLLLAAEAGDAEAERDAKRALERRMREEARKIQTKYIRPPLTVEFAVMYLATDGLYAEIARIPGLIEEISRVHRVLLLGPSLLPALLRTIQLGHVTLALEQKADQIRELLGATRTEMERMDKVLARLSKQAGAFGNTIEQARQRTRVVGRKLRGVETVEAATAEKLLGIDEEEVAIEDEPPEEAPLP